MFGEKKDEKEKKKEEKKEDVMTSKFLTTLTWQVGKNEKTLVAIQVRNMPPHLPQNCVNCVCVFFYHFAIFLGPRILQVCSTCFNPNIFPKGPPGRYQCKLSWRRR